MTKALTLLTLFATPILAGCNGALVGNVVVLAVTFGIFFGTLRLGRTGGSEATRSEAPSSSTAGRS